MNLRHAALALSAVPVLLLAACGTETPAAQTVTTTATTTATSTSVSTSKTTLTPEPAGTVTVSATVTETPAAQTVVETTTLPAPGPATAFSDGTYLVGTNIEPGRYKGTLTDRCYWKRMDSAGETIDNDYGGSNLIVVQDGDYAIQVQNCGDFTKVG